MLLYNRYMRQALPSMSTQTRVRDWIVLNEEASLKSAIELMGSVSYKIVFSMLER